MKENLYKVFIAFFIFGMANVLFAQELTVTGVVNEKATGMSIPGATVLQKGSTNGTISDMDGNYSITVSSSTDTLVFSFIGYQETELVVNGRTVINVELEDKLAELDEVVVIGYGTQKKKVVTGSIATVKSKEITSTPILRAEQALQGRASGVQVTNQSGQPGEAPSVRIRGAGTTGNSAPLYVVDGLVVGSIEYLNPGDIESMDVLKDAASAAIYGARAANGVVLITTKQGKKGEMSLSYSYYYGIQNAAKTLDMLEADDYKMLMNEGARNSGLTEPFDLNEITPYNTNWQDEMFVQNAPMTNHELSVVGGGEVSTFASSFSYFSQEGIIGGEKSQFDRITARLNSNHQINNWLSFGNNLSYSHIKRRSIGSNESFNGIYSSALNLDPLTPLYETNADILNQAPYSTEPVLNNTHGDIYGISNYVGAEVVNPMALLEMQNAETRVDNIIGNVYAQVEPIKGLLIKSSLGIDLAYVLNDSYRPLYYLNGAQNNTGKTSVNKSMERYFNWQWENTISYSKKINDHTFSVLGGTTAKEDNYENLTGFNAKVPLDDPDNVYLDMAEDTAWIATGGASHSALFSLFGRITYDYKSRYAFTGIVRRDGSSKFGPNNRYGTFPSLGVSWVISDEPFMPEINAISFIKFRASWGINGNDRIGNYRFLSVMDRSRGYIFGSGASIGVSPQFIDNADLRWEESEQIDIALDFGFLNDRLTATVDYYIKTTNGLLEQIPILAHVGNDPPYANVGSVRNNGIELDLNWRHSINNLKYSFGINTSYNKNEVTYIGNEDKVLPGANWAIAGMVTRSEEGMPIGYFYGYKTDGLFQNTADVYGHIGSDGSVLQPNAQPGDVKFLDINGDNVINDDDRTMIGNPIPKWTLGIHGSANYKQFDFSFLMTGAFGHDIFNGSQRQDLRYTNRPTSILERWTAEGTSNTTPRYTWVDGNNNYRVSDLYIEDGSYLRLKNIQFGYNIPLNLLRKIKVKKWRFYVSAENLLTFTSYTGADPEIGSRSAFDTGIDRGIYPQARTFRFGTSITF